MPKGIPNKKYTGEFKRMVVETMRQEHLSCKEAGERFGVAHQRVCDWERMEAFMNQKEAERKEKEDAKKASSNTEENED